jgi:hypothetical protein
MIESSGEATTLDLVAYRLGSECPALVPAHRNRAWMDETPGRFAYRCIPLTVANQAGWFVLNPHQIRAVWDGRADSNSLIVEYPDGLPAQLAAVSHFGAGILTFRIPILFKTPIGFDLLARGPANMPKPGAYPLEGIVEADSWYATFTMNWKLLSKDVPVTFEVGEPICMIVPQRRSDLQCFVPRSVPIEAEPELLAKYKGWQAERIRVLSTFKPRERHNEYIRNLSELEAGVRRNRQALRTFEEGG